MLALFAVATSVGLGNLGAATTIGISGVDGRLRLRIALIFGLFEAAMPLVGLLLGRSLADNLGTHAKVVAGVVLCIVGAYTVLSQIRPGVSVQGSGPPSIARLIVLGVTLSIDNLAVGFALGSYHVNVWFAALVIGAFSVALTLVGLELGVRLGQRMGRRSELASGLMLIAIGVVIATQLL